MAKLPSLVLVMVLMWLKRKCLLDLFQLVLAYSIYDVLYHLCWDGLVVCWAELLFLSLTCPNLPSRTALVKIIRREISPNTSEILTNIWPKLGINVCEHPSERVWSLLKLKNFPWLLVIRYLYKDFTFILQCSWVWKLFIFCLLKKAPWVFITSINPVSGCLDF